MIDEGKLELECIIVEYAERYGFTERARQYFLSIDPESYLSKAQDQFASGSDHDIDKDRSGPT